MSRPALCFLLLTVTAWGRHCRGAEIDNQGRCIYPYGDNVTHHILNQTQSREISCFSRHMRGSVYHHYMLEASTGENPLPVWDILHCEAPTHSLQNLNVHRDTDRSGVQVLISSGPCMSVNGSHGENCTFVILYLNISYYDHHNGSTIPLCGFQRVPHHNLECFCIHYILEDNGSRHTTTIGKNSEQVSSTTADSTTHHTSIDSQGASKLAAAFKGAVPVLVVVIVVLVVVVAVLLTVVYKRKKHPRQSVLPVVIGMANNDEDGDHDFEAELETGGLLRSYSCPAGSTT